MGPEIDSDRTTKGHELIWAELANRGIRHTFHWGQALPLNPHWVKAGFGEARVKKWLEQRAGFLSPAGRHMFANRLMDRLGLSGA